MNRTSVFLVAIFLAPLAHADVFYECNIQRDYISNTEENYTKIVPVHGNKEKISAPDMTEIAGQDRGAYRKGTKPIVKHCRLSSGEYTVKFDAYWINANLDGLDGGDNWVTVEITNGKNTVLSRTVMGRCDSSRPPTPNCKDSWAVNIWLSGRTAKPRLTRLIDEYPP